jgi:hypothetical protein
MGEIRTLDSSRACVREGLDRVPGVLRVKAIFDHARPL